jgi:hypothetical protein
MGNIFSHFPGNIDTIDEFCMFYGWEFIYIFDNLTSVHFQDRKLFRGSLLL